jgi:hypothetical protein
MRLDPEVHRRKFDCEVKRLVDQRSTLEQRGIFVSGSSPYPCIDVLYIPRNNLRLGVPVASTPDKQLPPNSFQVVEIPSLAARGIKARFDLSDYDLLAPSLEFLDPWTDQPLPFETMFRAIEFEPVRGAHIVLLPDHPIRHRPFLCLRGIREYHEHPQHSGDDWFLYRDTLSLFSIIMSVWRVAVDIVRAQLLIVPAQGQLQIQVNWTADPKD